jgi:hypothetical protein
MNIVITVSWTAAYPDPSKATTQNGSYDQYFIAYLENDVAHGPQGTLTMYVAIYISSYIPAISFVRLFVPARPSGYLPIALPILHS